MAAAERRIRRIPRPIYQKRTGDRRSSPSALQPAARRHWLQFWRNSPLNFRRPSLSIQHVDAQFAEGLADWLGSQIRLPVRLARDGDRPQTGVVLIAGTKDHLVFAGSGRLGYTAEPIDTPYRPSIDVFLKSIPRYWHGKVVGVLLTGMGRDGAEGLKVLHATGYHTLVQNEATCAVYGMPKAATELKAASEILPLEKIGPRIAALSIFKPR